MDPLISVVIPAFNAENTIAEAVESVLEQTYSNVEIVVVDDGSTDGTVSVLRGFADKIAILTGPNSGHAAARRLGHEACAGELIAWLDADDLARPERLQVQVDAFRRYPSVVLVSSDFRPFDADGPREWGLRRCYGLEGRRSLSTIYGPGTGEAAEGSGAVRVADVSNEIVLGNFVHPPTVMVRAEAYGKFAPLPAGLPIAEDWLTFAALSRAGDFAHVDVPLVQYRLSDAQMSSSRRWAESSLEIVRATELIMARHSQDLDREASRRMRALLAQRHIDVANSLSETDARRALGHLWESLRLGGAIDAKVMSKALLPKFMIAGARRVLRTPVRATPGG